MAIYVHIPFCKQACHYCNFHFETKLNNKSRLINSLLAELDIRKTYISGPIKSIYLGGGTPSLLSSSEVHTIIDCIYKNYDVSTEVEITMEVNPDDLSMEYLKSIHALGINRLSIGIQSFDTDTLKYLNRAHNSDQAKKGIEYSQKAGFTNINVDLIYAIPHRDNQLLESDLDIIKQLDIQHVSAYGLTIEADTYFGNLARRKKFKPISENKYIEQFLITRRGLIDIGFDHYEVSNFAKEGRYSIHNSNYWKKGNYLGIGPGAHSYDGHSRQWNIRNNRIYFDYLDQGIVPFTKEILSPKDHINEEIITMLRTKWGLDLDRLRKKFNFEFNEDQVEYISKLYKEKYANTKKDHLICTEKGILIVDEISSNLLIT